MSDKIMAAFDRACDVKDLEIAALLLLEYERVVTREPIVLDFRRRQEIEALVTAHMRLWTLLREGLPEHDKTMTADADPLQVETVL